MVHQRYGSTHARRIQCLPLVFCIDLRTYPNRQEGSLVNPKRSDDIHGDVRMLATPLKSTGFESTPAKGGDSSRLLLTSGILYQSFL